MFSFVLEKGGINMGEKQVVYTDSMPEGLNKIVTKTHIIIRATNITQNELPLDIHTKPINNGKSFKVCSNM